MAKKPWRRDPTTGLPIGRDPTTGIPKDRLPDEYQTDGGDFDRSAFPGCDLFNLWTIATAVGKPNMYDFKRRQLAPCSSYFHLHQIVDDDGSVLGYVTRTNSAQEGERAYEAAKRARQLAGKRVSAGSGVNLAGSSPPIETRVTELQGSGAPFEPGIWPVPIATPAPRTYAPEARERHTPPAERASAPAGAVVLTAAEAPIGRDEIAARIQLEEDPLARVLHLLKTEGTIIGEPGGRGILYRLAP